MRRFLALVYCSATLVLTVAVLLGAGGCERAATQPPSPTDPVPSEPVAEAPLLLDDEPLLLLDEPADGPASDHSGADNSRCFVCHANFMQEKIAATHAAANISCADCHGSSDAHIADESWASGGNGTAPNIMYPRASINSSCMTCHSRDKITGPQHEALFAAAPAADAKVCTDCHGHHRMAQRRCQWK